MSVINATKVITSRVNAVGTCDVCGAPSRLGYVNPDGSRAVRCRDHRYSLSPSGVIHYPARTAVRKSERSAA